MEEEINNKWLEMIEEDEKRDGISMLEQICAENGFIKNWCWPLCWCVRVEESKKIIDFFAQIHLVRHTRTHSSRVGHVPFFGNFLTSSPPLGPHSAFTNS